MATEVKIAPRSNGETVDRDQHCVNCGYNLRTLATAGQCPECGMRVVHSLHNNELRYSNPKWVANLHLAVKLMLGMFPLMIMAFIFLDYITKNPIYKNSMFGILLALAISIFNILIVWLLTTPEPRPTVAPRERRVRLILRYSAVSWAWLPLDQLYAATKDQTYWIVAGVLLALSLPYCWTLPLFFRRLAGRLPNPRLARSASLITWGLTVSVAVILISFVVEMIVLKMGGQYVMVGNMPYATFSPPSPSLSTHLITLCLVPLALIGVLVFGLWFLILMFRMSRALGEAAKYAAMNNPKVDAGNGQ